MIFQEPMTSFSPVYTIGNQIMEAIMLHRTDLDKRQAREYAIHMLDRVGIPKPELRIDSYPGQLSGGMRQRAMIAMALVCNPSLLIADEPTTALDVTTQAQILDLMNDLQAEYGMAIMMITHNLGVVAETTEKVAVMYLGRIVESGPVEVIFDNPLHPYTRALLRSVPKLGRKSKQRLASIKGVVPDAYNIPTGCSFHPRCPECRRGLCDQQLPELKEAEAGHHVSCWVVEQEISQTSADGTVARGDLT